jgi:putative FmdB family regulatory protein
MPVYEYECESCGERFERLFMSPDDRPSEITCPECNGTEVHRVFSPPAVHSGEARDVVEEAATRAAEEKTGRPQPFDQQDHDEALKKRP